MAVLFLSLRRQDLASPWAHRAGNWRGWWLIKTTSKMDYLVSCAAENIIIRWPGPAPPMPAATLGQRPQGLVLKEASRTIIFWLNLSRLNDNNNFSFIKES